MQVFPTVEGLEVFVNQGNTVTLKQGYVVVVIPPAYLNATIRALRDAAREAKALASEASDA